MKDSNSLKKPEDQWTYDRVPHWLTARCEISDKAILLYSILLSLHRMNGRIRIKQERLAEKLGGITTRQVRNLVTDLEEQGLIYVKRIGRKMANEYRLNTEHLWISEYEGKKLPI